MRATELAGREGGRARESEKEREAVAILAQVSCRHGLSGPGDPGRPLRTAESRLRGVRGWTSPGSGGAWVRRAAVCQTRPRSLQPRTRASRCDKLRSCASQSCRFDPFTGEFTAHCVYTAKARHKNARKYGAQGWPRRGATEWGAAAAWARTWTRSVRRAAAVPIEIDDQGISNRDDRQSNVPSPSKRTRWDERCSTGGLSMTDLMTALAPIAQRMTEVKNRVTEVENQLALKVDRTLDLVQALSDRQRDQDTKLQQIQITMDAQMEREKRRDARHEEQEAAIQGILKRLETLERDGPVGQPAIWRRAGESALDDDRDPAVIIGGWKEDTDAAETLEAVRQFIRDRALPLPAQDAFVPGQQRGFAVVPLTCLPNESKQMMMRRVVEAVEATRKLKAPSGHLDRDGKQMLVWAAVSQPAEVRRKARLLAKSKRVVLESYEKMRQLGETVEEMQVKADYRRGTLMINSKKVGGTSHQPAVGEILVCDHGWVDAKLACEHTKEQTPLLIAGTTWWRR